MTEYQVTSWRDLPSMVAARSDGQGKPGETTKALLAPRFQEAIDEAAMRLGDTGADDYLSGWQRSAWTAWTADDATPDAVLERVAAELDAAWPADRVTAYLDQLGSPT